jgi:hypothetical protein
MRTLLLVSVCALAVAANAQGGPSAGQLPTSGNRCTTPVFAVAGIGTDNPDCDFYQTNPSPAYAPVTLWRIPVVVHVIQSTSGMGALTAAQVQSQIQVLDEDYRALPGTPGAGGVDTRIEFFLATVDPLGNPTNGIVYHTDDTWFQDVGDYWTTTAWPTQRYLNIYTNTAQAYGVGSLGYTLMPQNPNWINTPQDRVVIRWDVFGRPAVVPGPFALGRVCTHEVGHWLGLFHTFDFGCDAGGCHDSGDRICDTNPEAAPNYGCPTSAPSCGNLQAPVHNYMDYTDDSCMTEFTQEQARRMRCTLQSYRPLLAQQGGPSASVSSRSGAGNLNSALSITPMRLAQPVSVQVQTAGTGFAVATAIAFTAPANLPFGGGTILVNPNSALVFQLPIGSDPTTVVWSFVVPNQLWLVGFAADAQALLLGSTFAFSNAVDFVVGF